MILTSGAHAPLSFLPVRNSTPFSAFKAMELTNTKRTSFYKLVQMTEKQ